MPQINDSEITRELPGEVPEQHRHVFKTIDDEVSSLHLVWRVYRQLYAEKDRVDLLNRAAPAFAKVVHDALLDDVLLSLARLTDPAVMGKDGSRENLTLERLQPVAAASGDTAVQTQLDTALAQVMKSCEVLRRHRNKRIAHLDLKVALEEVDLPGYSRQVIEDALSALREVMNSLNLHFRMGPTMYEHVIAQGDGDSLIACLRDGVRLRELRRHSYTMSADDLAAEVRKRGHTT